MDYVKKIGGFHCDNQERKEKEERWKIISLDWVCFDNISTFRFKIVCYNRLLHLLHRLSDSIVKIMLIL